MKLTSKFYFQKITHILRNDNIELQYFPGSIIETDRAPDIVFNKMMIYKPSQKEPYAPYYLPLTPSIATLTSNQKRTATSISSKVKLTY